jgi:hypothetical protein
MAQRAGPSLCAENGQAEPLSPREGVPEIRVGEKLRIGRLDQQEDCNDCGFPRRLTKHLGSVAKVSTDRRIGAYSTMKGKEERD